MLGSRKLGIFFGESSVTFVETEGNAPAQVACAPFGDALKRPDPPFASDLTEEIQVVALLQKTMRDHKIETSRVCLSLPARDVILRSFLVPAVKPEELEGLVTFEAKKYVPFDIKDLAFVYHPIPVVDNKIKKVRIIFYAMRREVLEKYERICTQANLTVVGAEPASVDLAKALFSRNQMRADQRVAVLHVDGRAGRMMFFDKGIIQFVHEFSMLAAGGEGDSDMEVVKNRFLNETRNSMDYYSRQFSEDKLNEIIVLGAQQTLELAQLIGNDLGIPVKHILPSLDMAHFQTAGVDGLCAFGACVSNVPSAIPVFNFIQKKPVASVPTQIFGLSLDLQEFAPVLQAGAVCAVVLIAAFAAAQLKIKGLESRIAGLSVGQGEFASMSVEDIQQKIKNNTVKLQNYKKIRVKTDVAFLLAHTVRLLPEGVWLKDLSVRYGTDDKMTMDISGYAYAPDQNQQLRFVNALVSGLRASTELSRYISGVQLTSMQRENVNNVPVTYFVITCS